MKINNRYISRLNGLVKFLWIIILLEACQNDDRYGMEQDGPVLVKALRICCRCRHGFRKRHGNRRADHFNLYSSVQCRRRLLRNPALRGGRKKNAGGTYTATLLQSVNSNDNYKLVILANLLTMAFYTGCTARAMRKYNKPA